MKVSLIVAVYKDLESLQLIVDSMRKQTYQNFELVVAEDNNAPRIKEYVASIKDFEVKHTFQADEGIQKMRSLNNAILASTGEYLVFIDGDCIPYTTFLEEHVKHAQEGFVVSGRRANLGPKFSAKIRAGELLFDVLEKNYFWYYPLVAYDCREGHAEAGFSFSSDGFIYQNFIASRKSSLNILGCNYSCFKKDMVAINGYDESYGQTAVGDDTDVQWRFEAMGLKLKSCKYAANVFHLDHHRKYREMDASKELALMHQRKKEKKFRCDKGLDTH